MEQILTIKAGILSAFGVACSFVAAAFGGWTTGMTTLIIFMAIDYITGLIVAAVFHNSGKSETGALESKAGWKGLCRKGMTLLIVLIASRLDIEAGTTIIRDAVVIGYIANESISIVENAGLMGLPIPSAITKALEVMKSKSEETSKEGEA